jgi:hypothetical protein
MLIYGQPGAGKSFLGATSPGPRLVLDAESGARWQRSAYPKIYWHPSTDEFPDLSDTEFDTVIAPIHTLKDMKIAMLLLESGEHPFRSVVVDSLSEVQARLVDDLVGTAALKLQDYGAVLRQSEDLIRKIRDLTTHRTNPLECVVVITPSTSKDNVTTPYVKGSFVTTLPGFLDVVGYIWAEQNDEGDFDRQLLTQSTPTTVAKDRTGILTNHYGPVITNPNIEEILEIVEKATR